MTEVEALKAVQGAFYRGRYFFDPHVLRRMKERRVSLHDIKDAVMKATRAESYNDPDRPPRPGVTSWRVFGFDFDRDPLNVGVDLARDHLGSHVLVVTVF